MESIVGLVAVIMIFGIPIAGMYTYYRVRKLRTEERLAAIGARNQRSHGARAFADRSFSPGGHPAG